MATRTRPTTRDGVSRCARYAFGPNKLHLCGPDANREVLAYINEGASDIGLKKILQGFNTLYPYLKHIAEANSIHDPFDDRVVHAYWIGNELLETIHPKTFFKHLQEGLQLQKRYAQKEFDELIMKLPKGARMHHSFHVLNAYKRTGHDVRYHDLDSMDACRISWGRVTSIDGPSLTVMRKPLLLSGHTLSLGNEIACSVARRLEDFDLDDVQVGDLVTMHWGVPCEVITDLDAKRLLWYTLKHIELANLTL